MGYSYRITRVTTSEQRQLAKQFVNNHHSYIDWSPRPSRLCYWLLHEEGGLTPWGKVIGVFGLGTMFNAPKSVADYMKEHDIGFNQIGNNIVYCLYGHEGKSAATQCLKLVRQDAVPWWHEKYGDVLKAFQTFILPIEESEGYRAGTLYKADNWQMVGMTTGNSFSSEQLKDKHTGHTMDWLGAAEEQELGWVGESIVSDGKGGHTTVRINRTIAKVPQKMIYMRLISEREQRRALGLSSRRELIEVLENQPLSTGERIRAEIAANNPEPQVEIEAEPKMVHEHSPPMPEDPHEEWPTYDIP
mgnify:CR=1 FL=1